MAQPFRSTIILSFLICSVSSFGQLDSTQSLPQVEIKEEGLRTAPIGEKIETWDSTNLNYFSHQNFAELLEQQSGVFVKNYGPGTLSTLSTRGGSAGQTSFLWNGLPLQSPMLGLMDVSLLPTALIDEASLKYGGNSSLWGSGAIGGVISLENKEVLNTPFHIESNVLVGSFGQFNQSIKAQSGSRNFGFSTTLSHSKSENDFPYFLQNGKEKKQANAQREQFDFLQEFYLKINERQQLGLHFWWQKSDRGIPPLTTQTRSEATQKDEAKRLALHWKRLGKKTVWKSRIGFFTEEIDYRDPQILLEALSHFWNLTGDIEGDFQFGNTGQFSMGATQMITRAFADEYQSPPTESRSSVFASFKKEFKKTEAQITVRQSLVNKELVGLTPTFSFNHNISKIISLRGKVSRNYRIPTLNDRFWSPGGNPDLQPESGWAQEVGVDFHRNFSRGFIEYDLNVFNRNVHDWILWSPEEDEIFWSAKNLAKVWSRGIEQRLKIELRSEKVVWKFSSGYDFIRSTNETALESPLIKAGEQLIYTPIHQAFASAQAHFKSWSVTYRHRMVSGFSGQNEELDGHHLGYVILRKNFKWKSFIGSGFFKIENLWNEDYRVVERRPMPGRSFQVRLNFRFTKKS